MDAAKIRLSAQEQELVFHPEWILTKNRILEKVKTMLQYLQEIYGQQLQLSAVVPAEVIRHSFKISRGENYLGLPWLVLDYPRCFGKEAIFAVRTMFWWGNFFSVTLLLSGKYKVQYEQRIMNSYSKLCDGEFYISTAIDPWQHHFGENNYTPVSGFSSETFNNLVKEKDFIKLASKFPLHHWDDAIVLLGNKFSELMELLKD